jgi:hypothetical protein
MGVAGLVFGALQWAHRWIAMDVVGDMTRSGDSAATRSADASTGAEDLIALCDDLLAHLNQSLAQRSVRTRRVRRARRTAPAAAPLALTTARRAATMRQSVVVEHRRAA